MTTTLIHPINVRGVAYEVCVQQVGDEATFVCILPSGEGVASDTLSGLVAGVTKATLKKKKPVSIRVCQVSSVRRGEVDGYEVTGIHTGSGNILLRNTKSGERSQCPSYHSNLLKPITQDDRQKLIEYYAETRELERKRASLIAAYLWDFDDLKAEIVKQQGG